MRQIETIADELSPGEQRRISCPICQGHHERSMVVRKVENGTAFYKCHRASCGAKGAVTSDGQHWVKPDGWLKEKDQIKREVDDSFRGSFVNWDLISSTQDYHGLKAPLKWALERGIAYWTPDMHMPKHKDVLIASGAMLPLMDSWGIIWGWEGRPVIPLGNLQALKLSKAYRFSDKAFNAVHKGKKRSLHWSMSATDHKGTVVLVEDWLSAEWLSHHNYPAIALLGSGLTNYGLKEMLDEGVQRTIIWLDSGADAAADRIKWKYDGLLQFGVIKPRRGTPDPKDLSADVIGDTLDKGLVSPLL